ncbi:MAG: glycosylase [Planctomycetaceae bacterium]|nr:glycosylase [Planctomycetaceae bacterium]
MHGSFRSLLLAWVTLACGPAFADEPAVPPELARFEPYNSRPVFGGAGEGHWDAKIRERGWILRAGESWRLWYTGYDGTREGIKRLGLATSTDGLHWKRYPHNPLSEEWIEDAMVVRHEGRLYMFAEGERDQVQFLVSDDGLNWQSRGRLDVRLTDGERIPPGPVGTPTVFRRDGVWHLFYERRDEGVWLATSADLRVWTNVADDPVLRPGPDAYDVSRIALNQIVEHDGRFYGLYHGTDDQDVPALWTSSLAVSDDLRTWTKYGDNPLFPKSANRSSNILVPMSERRYRLYTMHDKVEAFLPTNANARE